MNLLEVLTERGFVEQTTHDDELKAYLDAGPVTLYIGFDPTASSLHVGSLVPIMSLAHAQRQGHRPIALIGGGTGLVGDPSGKTEMRQLLTPELVVQNAEGLRRQLARFIDFDEGQALMLNNANWLLSLGYIEFLRDIGRYFSVNRMIKAESYRMRLESEEGLNFIEFNYMLLQAYDFLELARRHDCRIQMGGSDQWGNIVAGVELVRRVRQETAFGVTFPLITTSNGEKMGKTAKGAVWLDGERTSPYDYYQFWVNTDDRDVERFLALFTFLPMEEVRSVEKLEGAELNCAKAILAYEATALVHGPEQASQAHQAAASVFGNRQIPSSLIPASAIPRGGVDGDGGAVPHSFIAQTALARGIPAFKLFHEVGLSQSSGAARRLIQQGGGYVNERRLAHFDEMITEQDIQGEAILLRAGKKRYHRLKIK